MGRAFKYKDGDYIGPVPIQMIPRLYKKGRRWFGEFQCPVCNSLKSVRGQLDAYFNTL